MRRSAATAACLALLTGVASADDRELFGLSKKPPEPTANCDDARTLGCATATDPMDEVSPYALRTWLPSSYLLRLPIGALRHDQVASYATGAQRDEAGVAFAGATGLENRWFIEGAPSDNPRNGGPDTRIPVTFLEGIFVSAGGFSARDRASTGGIIDAELKRGGDRHAVEGWVWSGLTAPSRARPTPDASYQVRQLGIDAGPDFDGSLVATGPLGTIANGRAWYAAGVAPSLAITSFSWRAARLVDATNDGSIDGFPDRIALETIEDTQEHTLDYSVPFMARAGWDRGPHHLAFTLIGNASRDTVAFANATQQAAGIDRYSLIGDAIATWRGTWKSTRVRGQLAWHRSTRTERAHDRDAETQTSFGTAYVPTMLPDDPVLGSACDDAGGDPYPKIPNCPVPFGFFLSRSPGNLVESVGDRPTATVEITHLRGDHVLRAGATLEDTRLVQSSHFTGGALVRSLFDGHLDTRRYFTGECSEQVGGPCNVVAESQLTYRTRYAAAYAEDTIQIAPDIRVDGGVRWELMWVGTRLHLSNELAPRFGFAWDMFGKGRARLWASLGRSFAYLPAGLGFVVISRDKSVHDVVIPGLGMFRNIDSGATFRVGEDIEPIAQDELTAGIEVGLTKIAHATLWAQGRTLRRGFETMLANEITGEFIFDNPGRRGETPASRDTALIAAEVTIAPANGNSSLRAGVIWGRTVGSWTGPFDPRQGSNLYDGTDFDFDSRNMVGPLPSEPGKRAFVEFERRGHLLGIPVAASTRLAAQSGRPRDILADSDSGMIYLLPRGAAGRGPMITQANVRLAARWRDTDITLDVVDVFDRRDTTITDGIYTGGSVQPIIGGKPEDLVFLKQENGQPPDLRSAFQLPVAFQAPLSVVLGVHRVF